MKVVVVKDDGGYYSTLAVAVHHAGWKTEYFVLDEQCSQLERIFAYKQHQRQTQKVVLVKDSCFAGGDYVKRDEYEGYARFVDDNNLLEQIRQGEKDVLTASEMQYYRLLASKRIAEDVNVVCDERTCQGLMDFTSNFRDAIVSNCNYNAQNDTLTLELNGIWGLKKLFLDFSGNVTFNMEKDYLTQDFFSASVFVEDNQVCFVNDNVSRKSEVGQNWTFVLLYFL